MGKQDRSSRVATSTEAGRQRSAPRSGLLRRRPGSGRRGRGSELATLVIAILAFVFVVWMIVALS
jgi:hypothetical protein